MQYIIPFAPAGESDIAARLQAQVFQAKYKQEMIVINKPGAGGGLVWSQMNSMPGDGYTIVGVNLPHIVLQPLEPEQSSEDRGHHAGVLLSLHAGRDHRRGRQPVPDARRSRARGAREARKSVTIAGSGTNSANHVATVRLDREMKVKTTLRAVQGYRATSLARFSAATFVGDDVLLDARDPAEGQDADARRRDREAAAAVSGRADVSRAGPQSGSTAPTAASACRSRRRRRCARRSPT